MKNSRSQLILFFIVLFVVAFVFNFVWESNHAVLLYRDHNIPSSEYLPMMWYVSVMDGLSILFLYAVVALLLKDILWMNNAKKKGLALFAGLALLLATLIEYRGVYVQGRWSYNELMPTIFGMGLSPFVQLAITGVVALLVARRLVLCSVSNVSS